METIKTVYFDLFFTLVNPKYNEKRNENDVLHISETQWENIAESEKLYYRRGIGEVNNPHDIINEIIDNLGLAATEKEKQEILSLRVTRFKNTLTSVSEEIINTLMSIKEKGIRLCLISNADKIDILHWKDSPLSKLFNEVVFSCEVGLLKPDVRIYQEALSRMNEKATSGIFIGDGGSHELLGAKNVGLKTIMVSHLLKRENDQHELIKKNADYYVETFSEILNYI